MVYRPLPVPRDSCPPAQIYHSTTPSGHNHHLDQNILHHHLSTAVVSWKVRNARADLCDGARHRWQNPFGAAECEQPV